MYGPAPSGKRRDGYAARVKYALGAIAVTVIGLVALMAASGHTSAGDLAMLGVAVVLVCFFAALPVVLGLRRAKGKATERVVLRKDAGERNESAEK